MTAKESIFREYDIRGTAGEDLDEAFACDLGRAFAVMAAERDGRSAPPVIALSRDCRLSSPELHRGVCRGLIAGGACVLDCGMTPSPALYYAVCSRGLSGGIQVTGSHNPRDDNGFKLMLGREILTGEAIRDLSRRMSEPRSIPSSRGSCSAVDAASDYEAGIRQRLAPYMGSKHLRLVVDAGNGAGGIVGPRILRALGCEVSELYTEPDGRFPNHHPDPTIAANLADLRRTVLETKSDFGIAWDGDADRLGVVDECGGIVEADRLAFLYVEEMLQSSASPRVVADVKCSDLVFRLLPQLGAEAVMVPTGHSLIYGKVRELGAQLGVEFGGHIFFADRYFGFDDGIYAAGRLAAIMSRTPQTLRSALARYPVLASTGEIRIRCSQDLRQQIIAEISERFAAYPQSRLDGVRVAFERGWGLVRASNTEPALVLRFEAQTEEDVAVYRGLMEGAVQEIINRAFCRP